MLKKVHILNHFDKSNLEEKQIQCSVCDTMAKSILYVCESGHVICKSCQHCDAAMEDRNESGDYKPEKGCSLDNYKSKSLLQIKGSDIKGQDLASGDHDGALAAKRKKIEEHPFTNSIETIIEFKNLNFQESKSSILNVKHNCSINSDSKEDKIQNWKIDSRPVVCPVSLCSKMVTIDSFMLHFCFDHSKVPRTTLDDITSQEVILKSTNFTTDIQCVATFIIETQKRPSQTTIMTRMESIKSACNSMKDAKLLLLMAVRLPTNPTKLPNVKHNTSRIFTKSIHTQTEKINENYYSGISLECLSKGSSNYKSCTSNSEHDKDEVILIWLCKLADAEKVFSITLLGQHKKRGYCYIGDAVHVREKQNPSLLYDRSECLIVKGSAISGLYDLNGEITAIVSILG